MFRRRNAIIHYEWLLFNKFNWKKHRVISCNLQKGSISKINTLPRPYFTAFIIKIELFRPLLKKIITTATNWLHFDLVTKIQLVLIALHTQKKKTFSCENAKQDLINSECLKNNLSFKFTSFDFLVTVSLEHKFPI